MPAHLPERIDAGPVVLRRWRVDDAAALCDAVVDTLDELRPWMPWAAEEPLGVDERRSLIGRWTEAWEAGESYGFAMIVDDQVVGALGVHRRIGPGGLEIGYWVRTGCMGRGYARAAAGAAAAAALAVAGTTHVEIHHDVTNHRSARIPEALGFTLVEERERPPAAPGETGTERIWRLER